MERADTGDVRCLVEGQRAEKPGSITICNYDKIKPHIYD